MGHHQFPLNVSPLNFFLTRLGSRSHPCPRVSAFQMRLVSSHDWDGRATDGHRGHPLRRAGWMPEAKVPPPPETGLTSGRKTKGGERSGALDSSGHGPGLQVAV